MTDNRFFADTYALVEMMKGNPRYKSYSSSDFVLTTFNIMELYYHCLQHHGPEIADRYLKIYSPLVIPILDSAIKKGMEFKLKYKHENLSYADCIGYALAAVIGVKFLTGDEKFKTKENVEFVK